MATDVIGWHAHEVVGDGHGPRAGRRASSCWPCCGGRRFDSRAGPRRRSAQAPADAFGRGRPARRARDVRPRPAIPGQDPDASRATGRAASKGPASPAWRLMVFLASGEDPNFGPYSNNVRKALRSIINSQDASTGIMGNAMYHHGFAMLGLAEAYGAVDERNLWPDGKGPRSIGQALELAVRAAITSQKKNPNGAWRYSPDATDADTSVSGAVFVGLLAARNAGIEVPDESINKAIAYLHLDDLGRRRGGVLRRPGRVRRIAGPQLDRHPGLRRRPPQGPEAVPGHARLPQAAARADRDGAIPNTPATTRPRRCSRAISSPGRNGTSC